MLPSWRPDKAFNIELDTFSDYMAKLGEVSDTDIRRFADLQSALIKRLDHFAAHGCKVSDHALDVVLFAESNEAELDSILARRLSGEALSEHEVAQFKTAVLVFLGAEYARRGWVQQYHIGALRNNNQRQFKLLGADVGFDSINDRPLAEALSKLLSKQNEQNLLPKTILYCLNPRDNEVLGTMIGNFQGEGMPGKMQFGSGWWFNDQKDGMERQMTQTGAVGSVKPLCRDADRQPQFPLLHPPRILPPHSVPDDWPLGARGRSTGGYPAAWRDGEKHLL
ncbi:glucuronate isomerase [Enterobacter cloacae]|uniref:Uronate isomerase n=1 Tax=Enterobacter cloacae TaxID=550 RepID=A0A377LUB7_ENTCL|nr:glucuronate isomerase [Enterobacter cloacae]